MTSFKRLVLCFAICFSFVHATTAVAKNFDEFVSDVGNEVEKADSGVKAMAKLFGMGVGVYASHYLLAMTGLDPAVKSAIDVLSSLYGLGWVTGMSGMKVMALRGIATLGAYGLASTKTSTQFIKNVPFGFGEKLTKAPKFEAVIITAGYQRFITELYNHLAPQRVKAALAGGDDADL